MRFQWLCSFRTLLTLIDEGYETGIFICSRRAPPNPVVGRNDQRFTKGIFSLRQSFFVLSNCKCKHLNGLAGNTQGARHLLGEMLKMMMFDFGCLSAGGWIIPWFCMDGALLLYTTSTSIHGLLPVEALARIKRRKRKR